MECRSAIPFESEETRDALSTRFNVMGIPRVVVVSGVDGKTEVEDARALITSKKTLSGIF